jgi:hypothetical protein
MSKSVSEKDLDKHSRKSKSLKLNETPVKTKRISILSFFTGKKKELEKKDSQEKIKISGPVLCVNLNFLDWISKNSSRSSQ